MNHPSHIEIITTPDQGQRWAKRGTFKEPATTYVQIDLVNALIDEAIYVSSVSPRDTSRLMNLIDKAEGK